jgi:hypothetical protein
MHLALTPIFILCKPASVACRTSRLVGSKVIERFYINCAGYLTSNKMGWCLCTLNWSLWKWPWPISRYFFQNSPGRTGKNCCSFRNADQLSPECKSDALYSKRLDFILANMILDAKYSLHTEVICAGLELQTEGIDLTFVQMWYAIVKLYRRELCFICVMLLNLLLCCAYIL